MKVTRVETIKLDKPIPVYDVNNSKPYHNFIIQGKTKDLVVHNCGIMDEVSFVNKSNPDLNESKMMEIYHSVKTRIFSRFTEHNESPCMLFIVSSKKSEYDFLEQYIKEVKGDPLVKIVDEPLWNIKPKGTYSEETFNVALGNKKLKNLILKDGEDVESYLKSGYQIIRVPIDFKTEFDKALEKCLTDFAGISSREITKFIEYDRLQLVYSKSESPFSQDVLEIGIDDTLEIRNFFRPEVLSSYLVSRPLYIHIDTSLTGDRTGITCMAIAGAKKVNKSGLSEDVLDMIYKAVFSVGIKAPPGGEISLAKTRNFLYYLKFELGWNIKKVSLDGFQSADTRQLLKGKGFETEYVSVDRTDEAYVALRSAIYERRVALIRSNLLETELIELMRTASTGKIDHPKKGSKDIADSVAGSLYSAFKYNDEYISSHGEYIDVALDIEDSNKSLEDDLTSWLVEDAVKEIKEKEDVRPVINSIDELDIDEILERTSPDLAKKHNKNRFDDDDSDLCYFI